MTKVGFVCGLKKINPGNYIFFSDELIAQVLNKSDKGLILKFEFKGNFFNHLYNVGIMPIPLISVNKKCR